MSHLLSLFALFWHATTISKRPCDQDMERGGGHLGQTAVRLHRMEQRHKTPPTSDVPPTQCQWLGSGKFQLRTHLWCWFEAVPEPYTADQALIQGSWSSLLHDAPAAFCAPPTTRKCRGNHDDQKDKRTQARLAASLVGNLQQKHSLGPVTWTWEDREQGPLTLRSKLQDRPSLVPGPLS